MTDIAFKSAKSLAAMVRAKKIGCTELLMHFLDRVERFNPSLNAIIQTDIPRAKKRARAADRALAKGDIWGPLHGVPMTVKESHDVAGLPSTWGVPAMRKNIAAEDSLAVKRWLGAGVTLFGKTNVPLLLADSQSWNEIYGSTNNPWNLDMVPGGSSGGASAALASGMTGIEMGSDIASSIRNPAHFCGLFGHKPTFGICPPRGHALGGAVAMADISVIGPLGRSAGDVALGLSIIAGPDEIDAKGIKLQLPAPAKKSFADYKIGIIYSDPTAPVDREVQSLIQELAKFLRGQKVRIDEKARPDIKMDDIHRTFDILLRAATSGRMDDAGYERLLRQAQRLRPGDDSVKARGLRGATMRHRDMLKLNEARHQMRWKWHEYFQDFDLLLCPVMCTAAFPHDHKPSYDRLSTINGKKYPAMMETFWAGYTGLTYLPSTVAPIGLTKAGLPVGVQIVAPQYGDRTSLHFAGILERHYRAFQPPPGFE